MRRLIESLSGLAARAAPAQAAADKPGRSASAPLMKASGPHIIRHVDLAPFECVELNLEADCFWRPGRPSARVRAPASFLKTLRLEISGRRLILSSTATLSGGRPVFELSSARLTEAHVSLSGRLDAQDIEAGRLIATARGSGSLALSGEAAEAHFETMEDGVIDAASLITFIAAAELSDRGMIFLRAREAIDADLRDDSQLLTLGSPRILEARRHPKPPKRPASPSGAKTPAGREGRPPGQADAGGQAKG